MSCRAVALALSAMPLTLALASILLATAVEGGHPQGRLATVSAPAPPAQSAPPPPPAASRPPPPAQQDHSGRREAAGGAGQRQQPRQQGRGCPAGQRHAVEYPMVCDPVYRANTATGHGGGSGEACVDQLGLD